MDPITAAIIAAIGAGAANAAGPVAGNVITDAYNGLKALLKRKFGEQSEVAKAVEQVEAHPDSAARQGVLAEEVTTSKAEQDPEIMAAVQRLTELLQQQGGAGKTITATFNNPASNQGVQAGEISGGTINLGTPKN